MRSSLSSLNDKKKTTPLGSAMQFQEDNKKISDASYEGTMERGKGVTFGYNWQSHTQI